ncbi:hypothetical protein [Rhodopirellula sp. MGV]|uniref:hypothetical protein n=1 Tax=Rhodopirellula sp. MGV TaxID=2023130 RepID=UPI000B9639AE|nr:hypothetical protein [Rhodopirellula sp. MGV]OYP35702.1 hypothetical protein CGZ80_11005 [Rhodopirellula sp. MGV]PNY34998.1 hypothetical protein C2E31_20485 [Rhodopirellula baltica]
MAASNRAKLIAKLHSELKKRYSTPPSQPSRPLLEHILYAALLQDAPYELADEGLAKCEQEFFDWNEVRVTTVTELTQVLSGMPDPPKTARRLKDVLQAVFEEFYAFDLDHLKKENLGKAVAKFEAMPAMTPFILSYTVQHGLGGHSIPIDYAAMVIMLATGIASQAEASAGKVPGLERAVPKSKAVEFSALLHEAGVALMADPKDKEARGLLDSVEKGAAEKYDEWEASKKAAIRRVKRRRKAEKESEDTVEGEEAKPAKKSSKPTSDSGAKTKKEAVAKKSESESDEKDTKKASPKKSAKKKATADKAAEAEEADESAAAKKKTSKKTTKKAAGRKLSKRKPR